MTMLTQCKIEREQRFVNVTQMYNHITGSIGIGYISVVGILLRERLFHCDAYDK